MKCYTICSVSNDESKLQVIWHILIKFDIITKSIQICFKSQLRASFKFLSLCFEKNRFKAEWMKLYVAHGCKKNRNCACFQSK